jgi:hypothetical protein
MIDFFQRETAVRFIDGNEIPDFHGAIPVRVKADDPYAPRRSSSDRASHSCGRRWTLSRRGAWASPRVRNCATS